MDIFLSVWTKMRAASREMIDNRSVAFAIFLYAIGGIGSMMTGLLDSELDFPVIGILLFCMIAGPIAIVLMQFIVVAVIYLVGKLFKGNAQFMELYKALSLGYIPFIVIIPFFTIWMATDIDSLIYTDVTPTGIIPILTIFVTLVMVVYSFAIQIVAISEANGFSKWKAFFTIFIPGVVFFILLFIIVIAITILVIGVSIL